VALEHALAQTEKAATSLKAQRRALVLLMKHLLKNPAAAGRAGKAPDALPPPPITVKTPSKPPAAPQPSPRPSAPPSLSLSTTPVSRPPPLARFHSAEAPDAAYRGHAPPGLPPSSPLPHPSLGRARSDAPADGPFRRRFGARAWEGAPLPPSVGQERSWRSPAPPRDESRLASPPPSLPRPWSSHHRPPPTDRKPFGRS
jgi:hypothetical protein